MDIYTADALFNSPSLSLMQLAAEAGRMLRERSMTLVTAESCTGGLISKTLTDIPGSSDIFIGGIAAYANTVKRSVLGVSLATLGIYGAVSPQVAAEMARGARTRLGADIALSTTGIAGPDGGSDDKPVGLVYVGMSIPAGTRAYRLSFPSRFTRAKIRRLTAEYALDLLIRGLK